MKKFSKLVLDLIAVAGIAFTASCKSDCEKAYDKALAEAKDDAAKKVIEDGKDATIKLCEETAAKGKEGAKKEEKKEEGK